MKPSEVRMWRGVLPFIGCFKRAENEMAAALMVLASQNGDTWRPLTPTEIGETLRREIDGGALKHLRNNPFCPMPDVRGLVAAGYAEFLGDPDGQPAAPVQFTKAGLDVLATTVAA